MNIKELQKRLKELGVGDPKTAIPERTLREWASQDFIPRPELDQKKTRRKAGCPPKSASQDGRNEIIVRGTPGRYYDWPEEAVFEAAACWALKHLSPRKGSIPKGTIKRVKMLVYKFFENVLAVGYKEDYGPDGTKRTVFSNYDIDPYFRTYLIAYEKALNKVLLEEQVKITYYYVPLHYRKNNDVYSLDNVYPLYKIVDVNLEHVDADENQDILVLKRIERFEYIDPDTGKPYKFDWDENGSQKFVKDPPNGERFLKYVTPSDRCNQV